MKLIFSALTLALALTSVTTAHAADKKLGNVIAVERTLDDVYETCLEQFDDRKGESKFASCGINVKKSNADYTQGSQRVLFYMKNGCEVEGYVQNGVALITVHFANAGQARSCLRKAIDSSEHGDKFKFIIYTVE